MAFCSRYKYGDLFECVSELFTVRKQLKTDHFEIKHMIMKIQVSYAVNVQANQRFRCEVEDTCAIYWTS